MLRIMKPKSPVKFDTQEAYNLWEILRSRYYAIEQIQILENYIHDMDFNFMIQNGLYKPYQKQINQLEELINKHEITLSRRQPRSSRMPVNTEAFQDSFIAEMILNLLQENISMHIRAIRTSLTSDDIRKMFVNYLRDEMKAYDKAVKYLKLKGWKCIPPAYSITPEGTREELDASEAFHLWNHLCYRYDSLEFTQIFKTYTHDPDFASILLAALITILSEQIEVLEKEMDHFGLPMPDRPPKNAKLMMNTEILDDEFMYREIFTGMQFMLELHSTAFKQTSTNDRLRKIFLKFLWREIDLTDTWIKYGRAKGWLRPVPKYKIFNA